MEKTIPSEKIEKSVYDILIETAKKLKSSGIDTMEIKNMKIIGYKQYEERVMLITYILIVKK
jgi:kynurenine formamidase